MRKKEEGRTKSSYSRPAAGCWAAGIQRFDVHAVRIPFQDLPINPPQIRNSKLLGFTVNLLNYGIYDGLSL